MVLYHRVIVSQTNTSVKMEGAKAQPRGGLWVERGQVKAYNTNSTVVGIAIDGCMSSFNNMLQDRMNDPPKTNTSAKAQDSRRPQLCG